MERGLREPSGWSYWSLPGWCRITFGHVWGRFNSGTMEAVPPVLALNPHNSVSSCMFLVPPELLSLHESPSSVPESQSLCAGPLRGPQVPAASGSPRKVKIPADFHSRMLCRFLFSSLESQAGVELKPLISWGGSLQLTDPSEFSTATRARGTSLFRVSYPSRCGFFFMPIVIGHNWSSDGYSG